MRRAASPASASATRARRPARSARPPAPRTTATWDTTGAGRRRLHGDRDLDRPRRRTPRPPSQVVNVDNTPPTASLDDPGAYGHGTIPLSVTASDTRLGRRHVGDRDPELAARREHLDDDRGACDVDARRRQLRPARARLRQRRQPDDDRAAHDPRRQHGPDRDRRRRHRVAPQRRDRLARTPSTPSRASPRASSTGSTRARGRPERASSSRRLPTARTTARTRSPTTRRTAPASPRPTRRDGQDRPHGAVERHARRAGRRARCSAAR